MEKDGLLSKLIGDVNADVKLAVSVENASVLKIGGIALGAGLVLIIINQLVSKLFNS